MVTAAPAIPYGGGRVAARAQPKTKPNFGAATPVIAFITLGLAPTIFWGIWQYGWVFDLLQDILDIIRPGLGAIGRWILFFIFPFVFPHVMLAIKVGGYTRSQYPDPFSKTGEALKIYKSLATVSLWIGLYWAGTILVILFVKPVINDAILTPGVNFLIQGMMAVPSGTPVFGDVAEKAPLIVGLAQKAGLKVSLPRGQQEQSVEDRLCGGYIKRNDKGQEIKGGKLVDVTFASDDVPSWIEGKPYRATIRINNLGDEPVNVIVVKGEPDTTQPYKDKDEKGKIIGFPKATGSYLSGTKIIEGKGDSPKPIVYALYPLNDCVEQAGGCEVVPDIEKTVELRTPQKINVIGIGEVDNFISFDQDSVAKLNVQLKVSYSGDNKKASGTGHLLIFKDSQEAAAKQKDSSFKSNYCPITGPGPLDVVVSPPFYTVGKGYFQASVSECTVNDLKPDLQVSGYCLNNIKSVKIKLKNTAQENTKITLKSLKVFPFKNSDGRFPTEYYTKVPSVTSKNCFLEGYEQGEDAVLFSDESGLDVNSNNFVAALPYFRTDATFICNYQINDFPPGHTGVEHITQFKDFQFGAEVEYDYKTDFQKSNILRASND